MWMLSNRDLSFPVIPLIRPGGQRADAGEDVRPGSLHQGSQGDPSGTLKGTR